MYALTAAGVALLAAVAPARPERDRRSCRSPRRPACAATSGAALAARVRLLSWVSLGYMALEGTIAIVAGIVAGSVALIGFGLDSAIEGFASAIIVWRFTGHRMLQRRRGAARAEARRRAVLRPRPLRRLRVRPRADRWRPCRHELARHRPQHQQRARDALPGPGQAAPGRTARVRGHRRARAARTCSAPTSQVHCWSAWWATPVRGVVARPARRARHRRRGREGGPRGVARRGLLRRRDPTPRAQPPRAASTTTRTVANEARRRGGAGGGASRRARTMRARHVRRQCPCGPPRMAGACGARPAVHVDVHGPHGAVPRGALRSAPIFSPARAQLLWIVGHLRLPARRIPDHDGHARRPHRPASAAHRSARRPSRAASVLAAFSTSRRDADRGAGVAGRRRRRRSRPRRSR